MTKIEIYIDFEAISAPFSYKIKVPNELPYAYSIGIHVDNKFKTRTHIIDFKNINIFSIYDYIRFDITKKIKNILDDKNFIVNSSTIRFVGWSPQLEKKILNNVFKGVEVIDQIKGRQMSLSSLTKKAFNNKLYFEELKKSVIRDLDPNFIQKRGLHHDGALAALAGYLLFSDNKNLKKTFDVKIDISTLLDEIRIYSKDDVERMSYLKLNQQEFNENIEKLDIINREKSLLNRNITSLVRTLKILNNFNPEITIKELKEKMGDELKIEKSKIEKLKNDIDI